MELKSGVLLVPPTVKNSSCSNSRYTNHNFIVHIGFAETIEALLILILTLGVIGANALVIFVINNRRYSAYIHQQPRYLITSLALNDLTIGLLIMPFGLLPALIHCWPYGEIFCQIQGLLRGALTQQSAIILVCMAVDRYMCALHPRKYYQHSSKKGCVAILSFTWIVSLTVFGFLVLPKGYYFNNTGLMACEPFYTKPSYRILSTCALYFPTTMVLMYCYGSSFHMSRYRLNDPTQPLCGVHHPHQPLGSSTTLPNTPVMNLSLAMSMGLGMMGGMGGPPNIVTKKIVPIHEKQSNGPTSRSMAAISLGFIVMVTPWTIQEIVTACTGSKLPPFLDFLVTWIALSNSFWNPFAYWVLNPNFRRLCRYMLPNRCFPTVEPPEERKSPCCHLNFSSDCDLTSLPMPPEPPASRPPCSVGSISGSVLGICGRSRANSLRRSASQHEHSGVSHHGHSHHHDQHLSGDCGGGYCSYGGARPDIEGISEKYWGEILERTVSSGSLYALQKTFPHHHHHHHNHQHQHQQQQQPQQQHYLQQQQQHPHQLPLQNQQMHHLQHLPQNQHHCQQQHAAGTTTAPTTTFATTTMTSFSKNSDDSTSIISPEKATCDRGGCKVVDATSNNPRLGYLVNKFSNSEPKLCEHFIHHDVSCAKKKCAACGIPSSSSIIETSGASDPNDTNEMSASKADPTARNIPDI